MNYLILTPDGVGSTYLQTSLTVFLNDSGRSYTNTHEIAAGLELSKRNTIVKTKHTVPRGPDFRHIRYGQPLEEVIFMLSNNKVEPLVSRLAHYVMLWREENQKYNTKRWYNFLNFHYGKIFYCIRDPFEYAMSWGIRDTNKLRNVYSVDEHRKLVKGQKYTVDTEIIKGRLERYNNYLKWREEYFPTAIPVEYNDFVYNTDVQLQTLTGIGHSMKDMGFTKYNRFTYEYSHRGVDNIIFNDLVASLRFEEYISSLVEQEKLPYGMTLKMNTLQDKKEKVTNFEECVDIYKDWCRKSNTYQMIDIEKKIERENRFYGTNLSR